VTGACGHSDFLCLFCFLGLSQFRLHFLSNFRSFCTESLGAGYAKEVAVVIGFWQFFFRFFSSLSFEERNNFCLLFLFHMTGGG
jgi:hypothetical protein